MEEHKQEIIKILNACCYGLSTIVMLLVLAGVYTKNWRFIDVSVFLFLYMGIVLWCSVYYCSDGEVSTIVALISFITYSVTVIAYLLIGLLYYLLKIFFTLPYVAFKTLLLWCFDFAIGGEVSE